VILVRHDDVFICRVVTFPEVPQGQTTDAQCKVTLLQSPTGYVRKQFDDAVRPWTNALIEAATDSKGLYFACGSLHLFTSVIQFWPASWKVPRVVPLLLGKHGVCALPGQAL
jgi:hypothetical protein